MSTLLLLWWKTCKREMDKLVLSDWVTNQGEPTPIPVPSPFLMRPLSGHITAQKCSEFGLRDPDLARRAGCWTFVGPSHRGDRSLALEKLLQVLPLNVQIHIAPFGNLAFKCWVLCWWNRLEGCQCIDEIKHFGFWLVEPVWGMELFRLEKVLWIFFTCSHEVQGRKVGR